MKPVECTQFRLPKSAIGHFYRSTTCNVFVPDFLFKADPWHPSTSFVDENSASENWSQENETFHSIIFHSMFTILLVACSSDWLTGIIFEFGATSLQPMSIGPGIKTVENQGSEKHCITPVVCHSYQRLPQNHISALAAHFWHFFLFPWGWIIFYLLWKEIWWKERHGLACTFSTSMQLMS